MRPVRKGPRVEWWVEVFTRPEPDAAMRWEFVCLYTEAEGGRAAAFDEAQRKHEKFGCPARVVEVAGWVVGRFGP